MNSFISFAFWKKRLLKLTKMAGSEKIFRAQDLIMIYMCIPVQAHTSAVKKQRCSNHLEGKRGNPRIKPPFPAVKGLYDCPTVVNNVETIAAVVPIINNGGDEYAKIGIGKSTGTKLISASGHINKPGVYEIELGVPVEEFIYSDEFCGGMLADQKIESSCCRWFFGSDFTGQILF